MPSRKRLRSASPVLGDDTSYVKRSKTGRPVRKSAGKRILPPGYVLTDGINDDGAKPSPDSDVEYDDDLDEDERGRKSRKQRRPSPQPQPLSDDVEDIVEDDLAPERSPSPDRLNLEHAIPSELSLTFNVPPGHTGPFVVNLDLGSLLPKGSRSSSASTQAASGTRTKPSRRSPSGSDPNAILAVSNGVPGKTSFLDLPAELRNDIYSRVLVHRGSLTHNSIVRFPPDTTQPPKLSAALLATCKQVNHEAANVLYGDNKFYLRRDRRERGRFHESTWNEIGWKDCRLFLQKIGPTNTSTIRNLTLFLCDGKSETADLEEKHRCVNDDDLMAILKTFARIGRLQKLEVDIGVRKNIYKEFDTRFVRNLKAVQADEVVFEGHTRYGWRRVQMGLQRFHEGLRKECVKAMERTEKLYGGGAVIKEE